MKKFKIFVSAFVLFISIFTLTACGGNGYIDYDLSTSSYELMYNKVLEVQSNSKKYVNKTFKLRGKIKSNSSTYHYITNMDVVNQCCEWSMEVVIPENSDLSYPSSTSKNYYVTGVYKVDKSNGVTNAYYLELTSISANNN